MKLNELMQKVVSTLGSLGYINAYKEKTYEQYVHILHSKEVIFALSNAGYHAMHDGGAWMLTSTSNECELILDLIEDPLDSYQKVNLMRGEISGVPNWCKTQKKGFSYYGAIRDIDVFNSLGAAVKSARSLVGD